MVGPLLLVGVYGMPEWRALARRPATWVALALLGAALSVAFSDLLEADWARLIVAFLAFPSLAWAGISLGPRGAIVGAFITAMAATLGTAQGAGPFALADAHSSLMMLWAYATTMGAAAMILAAAVAERSAAEAAQERDHARRLELEAQVRHFQRLESLGVLAGGIAHDFNNLLAAIRGNADLMRADLELELPVDDLLGEIELAADRAAGLCDQLLSYAGRNPPARERVELDGLLEEMHALLRTSVSRRIEVESEFAEGVPAVFVDAAQLRQVVMNLILNAADAIGDESGRIVLSTGCAEFDADYMARTYLLSDAPPGTYCYLEVSDDGAGMDEEALAHLFEPFFTTKFEGRGLGLAAVLGIVRAHDGAIKVKSKPGEGSVFRLLLPPFEDVATELPERGARPVEPSHHGTILVADDEESIRLLVTRALHGAGWATVHAADGLEAIERFEQHRDDLQLVILDVMMPGATGVEALKVMRQHRPDLPAILISGYDGQVVSTADEPFEFFRKPFAVDDLLDRVARCCVKAERA